MTRTVGLTGGIACGKSAAAALFRELGVPVVDADAIARDVVGPGTDGLREVVEAFGSEVLQDNGTLDRTQLGKIVFSDADARERLNAITHPRIAQRSREQIAQIEQTEKPYALYEAALLVENGVQRGLAGLVVVTAEPAVQLRRLMQRDGIDEKSARARINAQLPQLHKVKVADWVIDNSGDLAHTRKQVLVVHDAILKQVAEVPA